MRPIERSTPSTTIEKWQKPTSTTIVSGVVGTKCDEATIVMAPLRNAVVITTDKRPVMTTSDKGQMTPTAEAAQPSSSTE